MVFGVTGSGKTHTMFGDMLNIDLNLKDHQNRQVGLIEQTIDQLLNF
jgi:type II secretory ATPase GspE/PulE/Tfp pilus assembly ATPase PilB-like protein